MAKQDYKWIGKRYKRVDAAEKTTGAFAFISDMDGGPDCLHGKLKYADIAHAKIKSIDYSEALKQPGVKAVITAKDVPGKNVFGICAFDQPVFCDEKVFYYGDVVACVVAESEEQASDALAYVKVEYEPLPVNVDAEKTLEPDASPILGESNLQRSYHYSKGDVEQYFTEDYFVVEHTYNTPVQEHAYLECEFAIAEPTKDGGIEIWMPTQYGFQDRWQLCNVLNLPPEKIIEHSWPLGGAFGGKDDMSLQPIVTVCAQVLQRRVKITCTREESMKYSCKRLPFRIKMKTACDKAGNLVAHRVELYGDIGPFTGISSAVYDFALEHCCGAYLFPNLDITGHCVRTNRGRFGAFRGFGDPQVNYCMESQIYQLARLCGMDQAAFRKKNMIQTGKLLNFGTAHTGCDGLHVGMERLMNGSLWQNRKAFKAGAAKPWLKRGVGIACAMLGNGMGNGLTDSARTHFTLDADGRFSFSTSIVEMGQGILTTNTYMLAEFLNIDPARIRTLPSSTETEPDTGGAFASRGTFVSGRSLRQAARDFLHYACGYLGDALGSPVHNSYDCLETGDGRILTWEEVYRMLPEEYRIGRGYFSVEETPKRIDLVMHYIYSHACEVVGVEVNTLTGKVEILERELYPSCGTVINRVGYEGQCYGGMLQAQGYGTMEEYKVRADGVPMTRSFQTYMIPGICDVADTIRIDPVEVPEDLGPFGAKGLGEVPMVTGAAAIGNAVEDAVGVRVLDFPCTPERVLTLLEQDA